MDGDIRDEEWFFQELPPLLASAILKTLGEGAFLVRSFKKRMALSFVCDEEVKHLWIHQDVQGQCYLQNEARFSTVQQLVHHHASSDAESFLGVQLKRFPRLEDVERFLFLPDIQLCPDASAANECPLTAWHLGRFGSQPVFGVTRRFHDPEVLHALRHQARALMLLDHVNILKLAGLHFNQSYTDYYVIVEAANGGNLRNFLQRQGEVLLKEWEILISFGNQIASALAYLHRKGLVHNDLILQNCLIDKTDKFTIKLAGFLFCRFEDTCVDPRLHMQWRKYSRAHPPAPELLTGQQTVSTAACDIWSFGMLLWSMFMLGKSPDITAPISLAHKHLPHEFCTMMEHLIRSCLYDLPQLRMSAYEIGKQLKSLMDFRNYLNNPQYSSFMNMGVASLASSSGKASPSLSSTRNQSSSEVSSSMDSVVNGHEKKKKKRFFKSKQWKSTNIPRSQTFGEEKPRAPVTKGLKTIRHFFSRSQDSNMNTVAAKIDPPKPFQPMMVNSNAPQQIPDFSWNSESETPLQRLNYPAMQNRNNFPYSSFARDIPGQKSHHMSRSFSEHNVKFNGNISSSNNKLGQLAESNETLSLESSQSPSLSTNPREPIEIRYDKLLSYVKTLRKKYQTERQEKLVIQEELKDSQVICDRRLDELRQEYELKLEESEVKLIELETAQKRREQEDKFLGVKKDQPATERLLEIKQEKNNLETKNQDLQKHLDESNKRKDEIQRHYDILLSEFSKIQIKMENIIEAIKEKDAKNSSLQSQIKRQAEEIKHLYQVNNNLKKERNSLVSNPSLGSQELIPRSKSDRNASNGSDTAASNDSGIGLSHSQPEHSISLSSNQILSDTSTNNITHIPSRQPLQVKLTNQHAPNRPPRPRNKAESQTEESLQSPVRAYPERPIRNHLSYQGTSLHSNLV